MKEQKQGAATNKADNLDDITAHDTGRLETSGTTEAYPNKANESGGAGSPYGGTQTADKDAPDGNQQVISGPDSGENDDSIAPGGLGNEYNSDSSYGDKGDNKEGDDNSGGDARGFAIR